MEKENNFKRIKFTTKMVEDVSTKLGEGYQIKRENNPWWKNMQGYRKAGVTFGFTKEEYEEYMRCKVDIHYFAEKYCKIKREDGSIGNMFLRDYQKDILDLYTKSRYSVLASSRQSGKCFLFNEKIDFFTFNDVEKTINYFKIPMYEIWYNTLEYVSFLHKIKYKLYQLIDSFEKNN